LGTRKQLLKVKKLGLAGVKHIYDVYVRYDFVVRDEGNNRNRQEMRMFVEDLG